MPLEEAWEWLAEPERLGRWMAEEAEFDGKVLLLSSVGRCERGEILEKAAPRTWVLDFHRQGWPPGATLLSLRLHRALGGTEVDLFHEGFHRLPPGLCLPVWEEYRRRWEEALRRLCAVVEEKGGTEAESSAEASNENSRPETGPAVSEGTGG